ncbi:MAG: hypothetical protein SPK18_11900 [Treponema sp.]|nr:hypothetical protein [Treponema sp.]MDY5759271.1 hypothetical protein [Treponema sp.]
MKENITELKTKLKSQNRIKLFSSPNNHHFLYDAFSQNIYPINEFYAKYLFSEYDVLPDDQNVEKAIEEFCNKLFKWNSIHAFSRLPETHLTINFSNKCNLNCTYCYRHKNNKNVMSLEKTFEVLEYADKYFKVNNDEIIFSIDMTAEALLDSVFRPR